MIFRKRGSLFGPPARLVILPFISSLSLALDSGLPARLVFLPFINCLPGPGASYAAISGFCYCYGRALLTPGRTCLSTFHIPKNFPASRAVARSAQGESRVVNASFIMISINFVSLLCVRWPRNPQFGCCLCAVLCFVRNARFYLIFSSLPK